MTTYAARFGLVLGFLVAGGCRLITDPADPSACPQTFEFGNSGCARVVVVLQGPPPPWPAVYRWDVRAVPAREGTGTETALATAPQEKVAMLQLVRWLPYAEEAGDTASVWISAKLLEDPRPVQVGVPLPVFASDSVLHVVRFAPVGARPAVDTVRLTLQRR